MYSLRFHSAEKVDIHSIIVVSAQITIPHAALKDTDLGGYTIQKNTIVIVNLASIHLDPTLFEDPLAFRPERFLDDKGKFRKLDHYNPFGIGMV